MTYAEARRRAQESQARIEQEKGDTLRSTAIFVPEYTKTGNAQQWNWGGESTGTAEGEWVSTNKQTSSQDEATSTYWFAI